MKFTTNYLPTDMFQDYTRIILKPGKDQSLKRFHPWVFSGAVHKVEGGLNEGDLVTVWSAKREYLGTGHYQIGSIAVRLVTFEQQDVDYSFWKSRIGAAWKLRQSLGFDNHPETTAFRLVHAEGDGLPGLTADVYNTTVVLQMHTVGMYRIKEDIVRAVKEVLGNRITAVYDKSAKTLPFKADIQPSDGFLWGEPQTYDVVSENGLKFRVDWMEGQKTGFFVDQRDNRLLVQKYAANRDVLNMFCYTGGFSFYAMKGGAKLVHSVDSSAKAIALTRENVELNFPDDGRHMAKVADAFEFLKNIQNDYDLIILDPPAFAKHRNSLDQALQGYKRINTRAFQQIRKGGIVFTFSCSQVVSRERFRETVFTAAAISGRNVRILHQLTQPADHPVNIYHPESEYLKGLVLYVE